MERELVESPQCNDQPSQSEEQSRKPSKVTLVRRESSRLQNFLLKKIKFNGNALLMKLLCETSRNLIIVTQDNRLVFVDAATFAVTNVLKF